MRNSPKLVSARYEGYTVVLNNGREHIECKTLIEARTTFGMVKTRLDVFAAFVKDNRTWDRVPGLSWVSKS